MPRGSAPGERRGGRAKGTRNKRTADVTARLEELGCDPFEGMVRVAQMAMESRELAVAGNMYKELAQYVGSKRKTIEHTGIDGGPIESSQTVNVTAPSNMPLTALKEEKAKKDGT